MLAFDIRGDASRGDFDGVSPGGTIASTFGVAPVVALVRSVAGAVASAPTGSIAVGLGVFVVLIVYAYRRVL